MMSKGKELDLAFALGSPVGSIEAYQAVVARIPVLNAEEEHDLALRLRDDNDLDAARRLVLSHLRFVAYIARGYRGYGLPDADLIQEGNVGLMKAVKRFDPDMNVRLVSFAVHWIKAEIHEYILRNWRIVKVATTKAQRKLFFNLRKSRSRLGWMTQAEIQAIADQLGVTPENVMEMEARLNNHDASFDPLVIEGEEDFGSPAAYLTDQRADPARQLEEEQWQAHNEAKLQQALAQLDQRSLDILQRRWIADQKATLHELADEYQVSAERIRQLETNAIKKLKAAMEA
ncbi:MAG: RNA polymerase sigma factor RpoH [Gammaproteobacteria bacterium]|nr:RNA polymerase sigma factor RpoH [Gammaproteobacteria bacterium]